MAHMEDRATGVAQADPATEGAFTDGRRQPLFPQFRARERDPSGLGVDLSRGVRWPRAPDGSGLSARHVGQRGGLVGGLAARFTGQGYICWALTLTGRQPGPTSGYDPAASESALADALQDGQVGAELPRHPRACVARPFWTARRSMTSPTLWRLPWHGSGAPAR